MAQMTGVLWWRHVRAESSSYLLFDRRGSRAAAGRGLAFWFRPLIASVAEVPLDDRELSFLLHGRSADFQDVTVQTDVTWRVLDPELLAQRVDFTLDLSTGDWLWEPLEKIANRLTEQARQVAADWLAAHTLNAALGTGASELRACIARELQSEGSVDDLGITIVNVRVAHVRADSEVERALQTPARELLQQQADKATFERRALAVERERAIEENELNNRIELSRQEEDLVQQQGLNCKRQAQDEAEAAAIRVRVHAESERIRSEAEADGIRQVESARAEAERARVDIYRDLPQGVLMGLAARELAGNLPDVEHLVISPDTLTPILGRLAERVG